MTKRLTIFLCVIPMFALLNACTSVERDNELKDFRKELNKDNKQVVEEEEATVDDDLNPTERKEVDKIFKKELKERERVEKDVFSD